MVVTEGASSMSLHEKKDQVTNAQATQGPPGATQHPVRSRGPFWTIISTQPLHEKGSYFICFWFIFVFKGRKLI